MEKWECTVCGYIYDPAEGDPDSGIAPGTAFEDIPEDWVCPLCGVEKDMFEKVKAINTITSLARAYVFLRWALLLSIFSIIFSGLRLMINDPVFIIGSLAAFLAQIYLFIWGLMFSDFLPS